MTAYTPQFPVLIGDIGGTNARFQIIPSRNADRLTFPWVPTSEFPTIESALHDSILATAPLAPKTAILAAAGPITHDGLDLTNCPWVIRPQTLLKDTGCEQLLLMNDFEAQALALPYLRDSDVVQIGGEPDLIPHHTLATKAVIGPGTGLGVGCLIRTSDKWIPLAGEGGHVDLGPRTERDREFWPHIESVGGRISAEQALSGQGLVNLYSAIARSRSLDIVHQSPQAISSAALTNNDALAATAVAIFCELLGRVAGDLALTTLPKGGVYLSGGISQKLETYLPDSQFRHAFENKLPNRTLLESIPTYLVKNEESALLGLESYARNPADFDASVSEQSWHRTE